MHQNKLKKKNYFNYEKVEIIGDPGGIEPPSSQKPIRPRVLYHC